MQTAVHLFLWLIVLTLIWKGHSKPAASLNFLGLAWLAYAVVFAAAALQSADYDRIGPALLLWTSALLACYATLQLGTETKKAVLDGLIVTSLAVAVWAIIQRIAGSAPVASFQNRNNLAGFLLMASGLPWVSDSLVFRLRWFLFGIFLACLALSGSAGAWAGALCGGLYWLSKKNSRRAKTGIAVLAIALAGLVLFKGIRNWDYDRLYWWKACLAMARSRPWLGLGPGTFEEALPHWRAGLLYSEYAHSTWLQSLAEEGVLGFLAEAVLLFAAFRQTSNRVIRSAFIAIVIQNMVDYSLMIPANLLFFWALLGLFSPTMNCSGLTSPGRWLTRDSHDRAVVLVCAAMIALALRNFWTDQAASRARYLQSQGNLDAATIEAWKAARLEPRSAQGVAILAHEGLARNADLSIAWMEMARARNPLEPRYVVALSGLLEATHRGQRTTALVDEYTERYPFFKNDKRFHPS